ncbi:MAG: glucose 1-dehydrogenase [Syntrophorhabdales bacterium]|jgi:NAD(P)-dependent dehydrogenase (short-subunit alcohol dehydrogenase family)
MGDEEKKDLRYDFGEEVAIVTGGAAGLGRVIALAFARQGAAVVAADLNASGGEETVRRIEEAGGTAAFVRTDVSREDDVRNFVAFAVERYGKIDFACNNAGIEGGQVPIAELPRDRWDQVVAVNLTGVFQCLKYELQQMLKQGHGAIVNIASVAGLIGTPARAGYVATKHGIIGLTKTAALEVANKGIRVNAVAPGLVNAGLTDAAPREFVEKALAAQPIGRMAEAEEIAAAVLWLCSDAASFVLGHTLPVEGGFTIA